MDKHLLMTHPAMWNKQKDNSNNKHDLREFFHVHGFVTGKNHMYPGCKNDEWECVYPTESGPLILSEDSYYFLEQEEAYNWSGSIQSSFLNTYNCLFIGFSARDYNFRRILRQLGKDDSTYREQSLDKHPRHYLFLSIRKVVESVYDNVIKDCEKCTVSDKEFKIKLLVQRILKCMELYWNRFGITPIWITTAELPNKLVQLIE